MASNDHDRTPSPASTTYVLGGVDLAALLERPAPFATLFLSAGPDLAERARGTIGRAAISEPHQSALLERVDDSVIGGQIIVADAVGASAHFVTTDPFAADVARTGSVPALTPLLEVDQLTARHAVVTVDDDVFAITDFSPVGASERAPRVFEAIDHLVDELRLGAYQLIAVVGETAVVDDTIDYVSGRLHGSRLTAHPTTDIDGDLPSIADDVVTSAASLAAERRTHELGHFREARRAGLGIEGDAVLGAIADGRVARVLVHDDFDDPTAWSIGLPDRAVAAAIASGVPITTIPKVPDDRGPSGGVGAILAGYGATIDRELEPTALSASAELDNGEAFSTADTAPVR